MRVAGKRYGGEAYPVANRANQALVALSNRYLVDPAGLEAPDDFAATPAAVHIVAAANVVRRASGIFMIAVECTSSLAAPDTQQWALGIFDGATATGGIPYGDWLLQVGTPIVVAGSTASLSVSVWLSGCVAGTLLQTAILTGANAQPILQDQAVIAVIGGALGGTLNDPGGLAAVAYELP